ASVKTFLNPSSKVITTDLSGKAHLFFMHEITSYNDSTLNARSLRKRICVLNLCGSIEITELLSSIE
ncbi:MAG TPA: hypothetical protein VJ201_03105, partial [Candidatus Babeliales bacterium]|nr:hypothetical protein [Candidatus Babeliales bacterium]